MKPLSSLLAAALVAALGAAALAAPDDAFDSIPKEPIRREAAPAAAPAGHKAIDTDDRLWIVVSAADSASRSAVANAGISIEEVMPDKVGGIGNPRMLARLRRKGISFTAIPLKQRFAGLDFPSEDSAFRNFERMKKELDRLVSGGAGLVSLISIGQSTNGKDLWALRLNTTASGAQKSDKPGIVFLGTHHAREHLSTEVPLLLAAYLVENRAKPEIAALLKDRDIYVIPLVNPDGSEYDIRDGSYHMHRKNTRDNGGGSVGVDLNRNYGFHWGEGGASTDPDSDIYRGPSAFSEPETQAVRKFVEDRPNLKILLSFHTFSELILYPWGHSNDPIPDAKALAAYTSMAQTMAKWNGYKPEQSSELYIASGDTTDWAWGVHKIFSFTFELTPKSMWSGGFYPGAGAITSTFQANLRPALYLIGLADNPYRAAEAGASLTGLSSPASPGGR